jgi:hypothetical protein
MTAMSPSRSIALVPIVAALVAAACSGSDEEAPRKANLAEVCTLNTDCQEPLVCAFRRCHVQCAENRDCPPGTSCIECDRPFHVCQLADERQCTHNSQCSGKLVCAVDGICRTQCLADRDCLPSERCAELTCAQPAEMVDGGLPHKLGLDASGGAPCLRSSDCPEHLVCRSGVCTVECLGDKDCPLGTLCDRAQLRCLAAAIDAGPDAPGGDAGAGGSGGSGGSAGSAGSGGQPDAGPDTGPDASQDGGQDAPADVPADLSIDAGFVCSYNSDCVDAGAGLVCKSGKCVPECKLDIDCPKGSVCVGGKCVAVAPDGAPDGWGAVCNLNSDCTAPLVCAKSGQCVWECASAFDCVTGWCCVQHACVSGQACAPPDAGADAGPDAGADAGQDAGDAKPPCTPCTSNDLCDNKLWCDGIEVCYAGCCAPALDTPCNSHSACVQDSCVEATHTCGHKVLAGEDADKDGHLALLCVGGDDCDDGDKNTYFGAPELCDGKDNDCNGTVDDGARAPKGLPFGGTSEAVWMNGGGAGAPLGTGWVVFTGSADAYQGHTYPFLAQRIDASGLLLDASPKAIPAQFWTDHLPMILDAAGEASSALFVFVKTNQVSINALGVTLVKPDLTVVKQLLLTASTAGTPTLPDAVWTGSAYLVGWADQPGSDGYGRVSLVQTDGSLAWGHKLVPTPDATGRVGSGAIRVGSSGSTFAAAYRPLSAYNVLVTIFGTGGNVLHGPLDVAPGSSNLTLLAMAGTTGGYVVVWYDNSAYKTHARFVALDGTMPDPPVVIAGVQPVAANGDSDGAGAAFVLRDVGGMRFGYAHGKLKDGFDTWIAYKPAYSTGYDQVNLGGILEGSFVRIGLFYYSSYEKRVVGLRAGCQ